MLFVNASDYLPTSEAVGVRLTIHDKDEFPFPVGLNLLPRMIVGYSLRGAYAQANG